MAGYPRCRESPEDRALLDRPTRLTRLLAILVVCGVSALSWAQHSVFRRYSVEDGLSQTQVRAMIQDRDGYLWVGTEYGLSRFDGQEFTTYLRLDGLLSNRISAAYMDRLGVLWFGHFGGGLTSYDGSIWEVHPAPVKAPGDVVAIEEDSRGVLWVATDGAGLQRLDRQAGLVRVSEQEFPESQVYALQHARGRMWLATPNGLFTARALGTETTPDSQFEFTPVDSLEQTPVALAQDALGHLWVGTLDGKLFSCESRDEECGSWIGPLGGEDGLPTDIVIDSIVPVMRGLREELWIGTMDKGVICVSPDSQSGKIKDYAGFTVEDGLGFNTVTASMLDREGNLWFGTDGAGVSIYHGSPLTGHNQDADPKLRAVWCMARGVDGRMWYGTQGGLVREASLDGVHGREVYTTEQGLPSDNVRDIHVDPEGFLYLVFVEGGFARFDPTDGSLINLRQEDGLPSDDLLALAPDGHGGYWMGTLGHGAAHWSPPEEGVLSQTNKGTLEAWHLTPEGEDDTDVYDVFQDSKNRIWLATSTLGLGEFLPADEPGSPGKFRFHGPDQGLDHLSLNNITEDSRGWLWIATDDGGVWSYNAKGFTNHSGDSRVRRELVYLIAATEDDRILIGTNNGLYRYEDSPGQFRHYGFEVGFSDIEANVHATYSDDDGSLWFGTIAGAFRYDSKADLPNTVPPRIHITGLQVMFEPVSMVQGAVFSHDQNHLTFNFIGISTTAPERVQYQYMLEGEDEDWLGLTAGNSATYRKLDPGEYTFLVRASNNDGVMSPVPARLSFRIRAPFWRTWWFYAVIAVFAGGLLYAIFKWQVRRIETSNRQLETSVRERTSELEKNKLELENANHALQGALVAANQAASAKSAFLATMSHEIRTPLNGILGMAELLKSTELNEDQSEFSQVIHSSGTALLSIINDVLDLSKIEAGKAEIEEIPFDCVEVVTGVTSLMAPRAAGKGLEIACCFGAGVPATLVGDPHRLRQVLTNLVGNAIKFTNQGQVTIRVEVFPVMEHGSVGLRFEVQDSGIGIEDENQALVFEPFRQEDSSYARRFGGTGLGLAICKRLVERMGGEIGIISAAGKGSQFWFFAKLKGEAEADGELPLVGRRILVVDKNQAIRSILREQLEAFGAQVVELGSAQDLQNCHQNCEWVLVDNSGSHEELQDVVAAIRKQPNLRRARILVMLPVTVDAPAVLGPKPMALSLYKPLHPHRLLGVLLSSAQETTGPQDEVPVTGKSAPKPWERARILVVDDNKINLKVAERMLLRMDCVVECAIDGETALEMLEEQEYDLVFMDCQMPGMDGFEATKRIRTRETTHRLPIVALTANAMKGDREKCLAAGMDDYLSKPVNQEQVKEVLARWLVPEAATTSTT